MTLFLVGCNNMPKGEKCHGKCCAHENAHEAENVNTVLALPYYYQDVVEKRISENEMPVNSHHSIRTINPNGSVHTKIQQALPKRSSTSPIEGTTFSLTINGSEPVCGTVKLNSLSTENNRNETARRIASTRTTSSGNTLWIPSINEPIDDTFTVKFGTDLVDEPETITVQIPDVEKQTFNNRSLQGFIQRQIKLKGFDPSTHSALVAQNMRFIVQNEPRVLKDVEVVMETPVKMAEEIRQFTCDPSNLDHVTGLAMALEDHICDAVDKNNVTSLFNTVNEHRIQLEKHIAEGSEYTPSLQVNAAVQEATELLWETNNIGAFVRMYQRKMEQEKKGDRKGFGIGFAENMSKKLIEQYHELIKNEEAATNVVSRLAIKVRRSAKKRQLKDFQKAVERRLDTGLNDDLQGRYTGVLTSVRHALKGKTYDGVPGNEDQYYH